MNNAITVVFTVTASPRVMDRFRRFLALLHYASAWGHSNAFGMGLDGDGHERFAVEPAPHDLSAEVNLIGGVGHTCEIALTDGYTSRDFASGGRSYRVENGRLLRDGSIIKEA